MHKKTADKFDTGYCQFFPVTFLMVILHRISDRLFIHTDDPVVADGNPMGILPKVIDHGLGTIECFLAVWRPLCIVTTVD